MISEASPIIAKYTSNKRLMVSYKLVFLLLLYMFSIPNTLTFFRLLLMPMVVFSFFLPVQWNHLLAGWLFLVASLTDLLDGWIARYFKQETTFGAFLDPIADKVMVMAVLVLLVQVHANLLFTLCAILIASRELIVSALREWLANTQQGVLEVSFFGKLKTFVQMFSLTLLFANAKDIYSFWGIVALVLFYSATLLTLLSMVLYFRKNLHLLVFKRDTNDV